MKIFFVLLFSMLMVGCGKGKTYESEDNSLPNAELEDQDVNFAEIQELIISKRCLRCHSGPAAKGDVDLSSFESTINSQVITPGNPEKSSLYVEIIEGRMPPNKMISKVEVDLVKKWIIDGANR